MDPAKQSGARESRGALLLIVLLGLSGRLAALSLLPDSILRNAAVDPDHFGRFARVLGEFGIFGPSADHPSAYRSPLYPFLLTPWAGTALYPAGVAGLNLLFTALLIVGTERLARSMGAGPWANLAALLVAMDPILIKQSVLPMSETLAALLFTGLLLAWVQTPSSLNDFDGGGTWTSRLAPMSGKGRFLMGLLLGGCAMTKPSVWAYWGMLGAASLAGRQRVKDFAIGTLVALAACSPWMVRNARLFGRPILTTTHGGYTLWLGQNPVYFEDVVLAGRRRWPEPSFTIWTDANRELLAGKNELEADRELSARAWGWMREHPARFARSIAHHVGCFWSLTPADGPWLIIGATGIVYGAFFALAAIGLVSPRCWRVPGNSLVIALVSSSLVHSLYWSEPRMRAPLAGVLAVLAGLGAQRLAKLVRRQHI